MRSLRHHSPEGRPQRASRGALGPGDPQASLQEAKGLGTLPSSSEEPISALQGAIPTTEAALFRPPVPASPLWV